MTAIRLCASIALLIFSQPATAALRIWPGCGATLQACIDAASAGDDVRIDTQAVIEESLLINKSLTLRAPGKSARFGVGRNIVLSAAGADTAITLQNLWISGRVQGTLGSSNAVESQSLTLRGLTLTPTTLGTDPTIGILSNIGTLSAHTVTISQCQILEPPASSASHYAVALSSWYGGNATFAIQENQIMAGHSGLSLLVDSPGAVVAVSGNRIGRYRRPVAGTTGLVTDTGPSVGQTTTLRLHRNEVFRFERAWRNIARGATTQVLALNNTLAYSTHGILLEQTTGAALTGRVANNILAFHSGCALDGTSSAPVATADYNLYYGNGSNQCGGLSAGANDRLGDPRFVGSYDFRLRQESAAVGFANPNDQPSVVIVVPVPLPDYDTRSGRVGTPDMGAHEFSYDTSFAHDSTAGNVSGNLTTLAGGPILLFESDVLQMSAFGRLAAAPSLPAGADAHLGLWWDNTAWTIFRQTGVFGPTMPAGRRFHVLLDIDSNQSYIHSATAGNISANNTTLDRSGLNNTSSALPIVTQRYNPGAVYNNSSIGVWYDGSRWRVFNQAPAGGFAPAMPEGASFNVLIPNPLFAPSHHVFRTETALALSSIFLDHPLLNDTPCAHPYLTASYNPNNVYVPSALLMSRNVGSDGRTDWFIERGDGQPIPAGAAFHVYIDPQQSRRCREDLIHLSEFES